MPSKSTSITELNELRHQAVRLRLEGKTLSVVSEAVGLSSPTIVAAMKAYESGGWDAINVKPRGRPKHQGHADSSKNLKELQQVLCAIAVNNDRLWNTTEVRLLLETDANTVVSDQTAAGYLSQWDLVPFNAHRTHRKSTQANIRSWLDNEHAAFVKDARRNSHTVFWVGQRTRADGSVQLFAHSLRGRCLWQLFASDPNDAQRNTFLTRLKQAQSSELALVLMPSAVDFVPLVKTIQHCRAPQFLDTPIVEAIGFSSANSEDAIDITRPRKTRNSIQSVAANDAVDVESRAGSTTAERPSHRAELKEGANVDGQTNRNSLTHLQRLEAESIHIIREVVAEASNPVMLYSMGKDSAVMLHLARKAFFPGEIPFPLLHVDTTWKFSDMYTFRDRMIEELGLELLTYVNQEGAEKGVNPFTHGSELHTDIMKTQALKQALDQYGFDVAIGGARRDEEKSRAKERVFSFRSTQHRWEPKDQRPELWNLYNNRIRKGESLRAFPLSNWTELDIWQYIQQQEIPVVPLYFAAERPVVERDGALIMVDDERMPLKQGESVEQKRVRFRTLGCYPLTGALESSASTLNEIIQEMLVTKTSERQARLIDNDTTAAMEKKKQEGYF